MKVNVYFYKRDEHGGWVRIEDDNGPLCLKDLPVGSLIDGSDANVSKAERLVTDVYVVADLPTGKYNLYRCPTDGMSNKWCKEDPDHAGTPCGVEFVFSTDVLGEDGKSSVKLFANYLTAESCTRVVFKVPNQSSVSFEWQEIKPLVLNGSGSYNISSDVPDSEDVPLPEGYDSYGWGRLKPDKTEADLKSIDDTLSSAGILESVTLTSMDKGGILYPMYVKSTT